MKQSRRKFEPSFKAQVALEAIKEHLSISEISKKFSVSPYQVNLWKREFIENSSKAFSSSKKDDLDSKMEALYTKIGKLEVERDFLKKNLWKTTH